jgi:tetratricopeptide (TPR) repeat protein
LGWISLFKSDSSWFFSLLWVKLEITGYNYHERDKQAVNEANAPMPNPGLLKARLLFDGGYYTKALTSLSDDKADDFSSIKDKTEYNYRLGRINDALGKDDAALINYQNAIAVGKNLKYYYAAKAAVQMGKIYENKKNIAKAKSYFNVAINMSGHEQENSIENEAKQGLRRLGN